MVSTLTGILSNVLSFLMVIVPVIWIHELGHFLVGKWMGAKPLVFSVGFGRELLSFPFMGATMKICLIPLGGYVSFEKTQFAYEREAGPEKVSPASKNSEEDTQLAAWRWIPIVLAGPIANLLLSFLIGAGIVYNELGHIQFLRTDRFGTVFLVKDASRSFVLQKLCGAGCPDAFSFQNGTFNTLTKSQIIETGADLNHAQNFSVREKLLFSGAATSEALSMASILTGQGLAKTVSEPTTGYKDMSGPVGIATMSHEARSEGLMSFLFILGMISFSVGFFNLLPLGILDGGRVVLGLIEILTRRPISLRVVVPYNLLSMIALAALVGAGFISDIARLLGLN